MNRTKRISILNLTFIIVSAFSALIFIYKIQNSKSFSTEGFMPHGHCYLWTPTLVWTMLISDVLIGLAYLSISICLYVLVRRIKLVRRILSG